MPDTKQPNPPAGQPAAQPPEGDKPVGKTIADAARGAAEAAAEAAEAAADAIGETAVDVGHAAADAAKQVGGSVSRGVKSLLDGIRSLVQQAGDDDDKREFAKLEGIAAAIEQVEKTSEKTIAKPATPAKGAAAPAAPPAAPAATPASSAHPETAAPATGASDVRKKVDEMTREELTAEADKLEFQRMINQHKRRQVAERLDTLNDQDSDAPKPGSKPVTMGCLARHTITKFTGVVVGKTEHINGCIHLTLQPVGLRTDGQTIQAQRFDFQNVEWLADPPPGVVPDLSSGARPGGPAEDGFDDTEIPAVGETWIP